MDSDTLVRVSLIILAGAVLLYLVYDYNQGSLTPPPAVPETAEKEGFHSELLSQDVPSEEECDDPVPLVNESVPAPFHGDNSEVPKECYPRDVLSAQDLLPRNAANTLWAQVAPAGQGEIDNNNYVISTQHVGINTVGSSLRIPNLDLRSAPVIPNGGRPVSPWNNSSVEPDLNRRPLEIGTGC